MLTTRTPCCGAPVRLDAESHRYDRRCSRCGRGWSIQRTLLERRASGRLSARTHRLGWTQVDDGLDGYRGLLERRTTRQTGTTVGLYCSGPAGIESDPDIPWATVCEDHDQVVCHDSLTLARTHLADPLGWCEVCAGMDTA